MYFYRTYGFIMDMLDFGDKYGISTKKILIYTKIVNIF